MVTCYMAQLVVIIHQQFFIGIDFTGSNGRVTMNAEFTRKLPYILRLLQQRFFLKALMQ